jgi:hypothetical protein
LSQLDQESPALGDDTSIMPLGSLKHENSGMVELFYPTNGADNRKNILDPTKDYNVEADKLLQK